MDSNSRKRKIESEDSNDEDDKSDKSETMKSPYSSYEDVKCTYGLKYNFLKDLGITPPIEKWIHVSNFRCDKSELKEVLELAGHVVSCAMFTKHGKTAKVMYSHPLEAVQAVSMLNGQTYYGQKLNVSMMNCPPNTVILPKGLSSVGQGLGIHGRPLRDVVKQYTKYLKHKVSAIDESAFIDADFILEENQLEANSMECKPRKYSSDANKSNEDLEGENSPSNRAFQIINIEDTEDDPLDNIKKIKRDSIASDNGSGSGKWEIQSIEESKRINTITSNRDVVSGANTKSARTTPNLKPESLNSNHTPPVNSFPRNLQPSGSGPQMVSAPVGVVQCPPAPAIGSLTQSRPMEQFVPMVRPSGPPVGPTGSSVVRMGPSVGPMIPSVGPMAPGRPPVPLGPMSRSLGPAGPTAPFPSPGPNFPMSGPMPNPNIGPRPMMDVNVAGHVTMHFRNLPPTTTFSLLCEKLSQCGQVLSLQLTTPGCAVATFAHRSHADRCFQVFNGKFIDGHVIEVRFG